MRVLLVAVLAALAGAVSAAAAPATWTVVETTRVGGFVLTVQTSDGDANSPRLVIAAPGGATTVVAPDNGLVPAKDAMKTPSLLARNTLHSQYLYAAAALKDGVAGDRLVVVFGAAQDPDPFAIRVLALTAKGGVETLLADDAFELTAIADLNKGGVPELIGHPSWSQMDTDCLSTYDPMGVYRLSGGRYAYDQALSQAYNVAHYVWAGAKPREDIAVDLCRKGGPKVVPAPHSG